MKRLFLLFFSIAIFIGNMSGENLVILHSNDTHSMIESDASGRGGVLPRKAIIDSVRQAEKNVLLIDAGDIVQGTLYFKFFRGEVEYPLMEMMGYDIRVLGNHEFDNGMRELAHYYSKTKSVCLSANYDFTGTELDGIFRPYVIKKIGGKKIGILGININPVGLIAEDNIKGVKWTDIIESANTTAKFLRQDKKCDLVIAVTHIGYENRDDKTTDVELASASRDIDIIIGGHSHTLLDPSKADCKPWLVDNAEGQKVLITQCGKSGRTLGYIKIDLNSLGNPVEFYYKQISVTNRFDESAYDKRMIDFISQFKSVVDSINAVPVGYASEAMSNEESTGRFANWAGDFAAFEGQRLVDSLRFASPELDLPEHIDMGMMNVGGIRQSMPQGTVYEGQILSTFPFANALVILKIKGKHLKEALCSAAHRQGEAVSNEVRVVVNNDWSVRTILLNGKQINDEHDYYVCTLDYLAWGNDGMDAFKQGEILWRDSRESCVPILRYVKWLTEMGLPVSGDARSRFVKGI